MQKRHGINLTRLELPWQAVALWLQVLVGVLMLSGCASSRSAWIPGSNYEREALQMRGHVENGRAEQTMRAVGRWQAQPGDGDRVLALLEEGRMLALAGDLAGSVRSLQAAADRIDAERLQPDIAISRGLYSAAALALNDLALPYRVAGHEAVLVQNQLALNFLRMGQLERARFALNHADVVQGWARERHVRLIERASAAARGEQIGMEAVEAHISGFWNERAADPRTAYLNAFTYYLSGVVFELLGDSNRAEIEYRRALDLQLGQPAFAAALRNLLAGPRADARLIVIHEDGWVRLRDEIRVAFPWQRQILQLTLPVYSGAAPAPRALTLQIDGHAPLRTTLAADINQMAAQALRGELPAIHVRQVLRMITKYQMAREASRQDPLLGLGVNLWNLLSDKADLRSWSTLPANVQVAEAQLPPGRALLQLSHGGSTEKLELDLPAGTTTLLIVTAIGNRLRIDSVNFANYANSRH